MSPPTWHQNRATSLHPSRFGGRLEGGCQSAFKRPPGYKPGGSGLSSNNLSKFDGHYHLTVIGLPLRNGVLAKGLVNQVIVEDRYIFDRAQVSWV